VKNRPVNTNHQRLSHHLKIPNLRFAFPLCVDENTAQKVKLLKGIHKTLAFTNKKKQTNKSVTEAVEAV